jgi:4'-phosphopantetheinyl transferase EntD
MPIITKKYVHEDCLLGIWEITEDYDTLRQAVNLDELDLQRLNSFRNHKRKLEWLSVRNLVIRLVGKQAKIVYNEINKPFLSDNSYNISISHSNNLTSILLSKNHRVGIDLEYMSHRISNIAFKFINNKEIITSDISLKKYHLYLHWCAKEALYKICDKQDINFKENLTIIPFELEDKGEIRGIVENMHGTEEFLMSYVKLDNYAIVWSIK